MRFFSQWLFEDRPESFDDPLLPIEKRIELNEALDRLNRVAGYHFFCLRVLKPLIISCWERRKKTASIEPIKILDIGAGAGGFLKSVWEWSKRKGIPVELYGFEINPQMVTVLQKRFDDQGLPICMIAASAEIRPMSAIEDHSIDIVVCNHVVHHIRPKEVVALFLKEVLRISRGSYLIIDFNREVLGLVMVFIARLFFRTPKQLYLDGLRSVRRAYTWREIQEQIQEIKNPAMKCRRFWILPYWVVKSSQGSAG